MILNYSNMISKIQDVALSGNNPVYGISCTLAGVLVVLALIKIGADMMNPDKPLNIWQIFRPFVILFIVWNFTLVIGPINKITCSMSEGITASVRANEQPFKEKVRSLFNDMESSFAASEKEKSEEASKGGSVLDFLGNIAERVVYQCNNLLKVKAKIRVYFYESIISMIVMIVRYVIIAVSGVYLAVLGIIGPLVFALSLVPTFEQSLWQWLARYLQISLWTPLCSIINFVNFKVKDIMISSISKGDIINTASSFSSVLIVDLAILFMLFAVPSMAGWIIQSTGASGVHRPLARQAGSIGKLAKKVITK